MLSVWGALMFGLHVSLTVLCLVAFLMAATVTDWRTHRIPNSLTVPSAALGIALSVLTGGSAAALQGAAGLLVGLAVFFPLYALGGFGAGDVKAMGVVGAFLGPKGALASAASVLIVGALGALLLLLCLGEFAALGDLARRWLLQAHSLYATGRSSHFAPSKNDATQRRFPYALAIACGTMISLAWS